MADPISFKKKHRTKQTNKNKNKTKNKWTNKSCLFGSKTSVLLNNFNLFLKSCLNVMVLLHTHSSSHVYRIQFAMFLPRSTTHLFDLFISTPVTSESVYVGYDDIEHCVISDGYTCLQKEIWNRTFSNDQAKALARRDISLSCSL